MTRAGNVVVMVAVTIGGALAACSSDDAAPAPASVVATTTPTTGSVAPSTTSRPTTAAPTTTDDPAALAAQVEADLLEAFRLGREASQDPFNTEKEQAALDRRLGVIADNFRTTMEEYRTKNHAIRPNAETPASVTVEGAPTLFGASNELAEVQICEVNSWILVEVGGGPNGTDAVVNPDVVVSRATVFMRYVDGNWMFEGSNLIDEWQGATRCVAG